MKLQFNSLYWKVSGIFALLFLSLALIFLVLNYKITKRYYEQTTQKLNADVAHHLIEEVQPFSGDSVNQESLGKIMHSMMAVNPGLEVYLLDTTGNILSYVVLKEKVKLEKVDLKPIKQFINGANTPIYGEDPKLNNTGKIFSASEVVTDGRFRGYVYIILHSEEYDNVFSSLQDYYLAKSLGNGFWISILAAFLVGMFLLNMLLKRLNVVVKTVESFENGDLDARIMKHANDEIGKLSKAFNAMADRIKYHINSLKEVDQLRRDLIANISHDVRTPVSVIHGYVETLLMKQAKLPEEQQKQYLLTIMKSTDRLKHLLDDLFELSKLEARQIKVQIEPFLVYDLIADLKRQYQIKADKKSIQFNFESNSRAILVKADAKLIERVIQNLLDNAFKFTPEGGEVNIKLHQKNECASIEIGNSGIGIEADQIDHIFDRYYKVKHDVAQDSTGLGLAIVKNILEIHKVAIEVKSEANGNTTFAFQLPAVH